MPYSLEGLPTELIRAFTLPVCTGPCGWPIEIECSICGKCHFNIRSSEFESGCCTCVEDGTTPDGRFHELIGVCGRCDSLAEEQEMRINQ